MQAPGASPAAGRGLADPAFRCTPWAFARVLFRELPRQGAGVVALLLVTGLTEGAGLLLLVPLLALVGLPVAQGLPAGVQASLEGVLGALGLAPSLPVVLAAFLAVVGLRTLALRWANVSAAGLEAAFTLRQQQRLYEAIFRSRWRVLVRERVPQLTHALTVDVDRINAATLHTTRLLTFGAVSLVYLALALALAPGLTLLALVLGLGLLGVGRGWNVRMRRAGEALTRAGQEVSAAVQDYLGTLKTAKSYGAEDRTVALFRERSQAMVRVVMDAERMHAAASGWLGFLAAAVLAGLVLVSVDVLALPTASLLLLVVVFARVVPRILSLQASYHHLLNALPGYENVVGLAERLELDAEEGASAGKPLRELSGDAGSPGLEREVRLAGVGFTYRDGPSAVPVLADLHLTLPAGAITALVGPSGAGKSTVADLVLGLLSPTEGEVLVDGRPLEAVRLGAWRRRVGYVAQDGALLPGTVRANLLWANPEAREEDMWEALEGAAAADFVQRLPRELDTLVGERGTLLSGGERQRLALACALVRRPALLVLDEATSALDAENEGRILGALENRPQGTTVLLISHRLSAVRHAQRIHLLADGRIVESGSWEELLARPGRFSETAVMQGLTRAEGVRP